MTDYDAVGELLSSQYRRAVAEHLEAGPAIPSTIAADTGHDISQVSRALQELRDLGMVELLVSEDRKKGRIYGLTDRGTEAVATIAVMGDEQHV